MFPSLCEADGLIAADCAVCAIGLIALCSVLLLCVRAYCAAFNRGLWWITLAVNVISLHITWFPSYNSSKVRLSDS